MDKKILLGILSGIPLDTVSWADLVEHSAANVWLKGNKQGVSVKSNTEKHNCNNCNNCDNVQACSANKFDNKVNKNNDKLEEVKMQKLEIVGYMYDEKKGVTVLKWSDGTTTSATAESLDKADPFSGFVMAVAKKYDKKVLSEFEYWTVKKPALDKQAEEKAKAEAEERARIEKKAAIKRHKWAVHKQAVKIRREYEARQLAKKKWGISLEDD